MTTTDFSTTLQAAPVLVVWEVTAPGSKKPARVEVTPNGAAECKCDNFILYGSCQHVEAVQAERQRRGLKH
jgi:hypothetical protein